MRDLKCDLEICNRATPGPWYREKTGANFNGFTLECLIGTTAIHATGNNIYAQPQGGTASSNDADFIAAAREGWPEAIRRAIDAEKTLDSLEETEARICPEDVGFEEYIKSLQNQAAALRKENKQLKTLNQQLLNYIAPVDGCECPGCTEARVIQNLSCQVAALREGLELIKKFDARPIGRTGLPWCGVMEEINNLLAQPDPGEKIMREKEAYRIALEIIVDVEKKKEQKPYGTVFYTPTLESVQRFAGQILTCPEKAHETLKAITDLEGVSL